MNELTTEQKILALLAENCIITDTTLISSALKDADIAEQIVKYGDLIQDDDDNPEGDGDCECDHEALSNEEIQIVFDNDEENKKGSN